MERVRLPTRIQGIAGALIIILAIVFSAGPAAAHTGFESASPGDGDVVSEPVTEIILTFVGEAAPAGDGFVALDADGMLREPDEISSSDNLVWVLKFDEPLAGGDIGVRWTVAAPDAHPISGSFRFTVTAEQSLPDSAPVEPSGLVVEPDVAIPEPNSTQSLGETSSENTNQVTEPAAADVIVSERADSASAAEAIDLDSFLDVDNPRPAGASTIAALSRIMTMIGAVLVIGGAAFAAFGLRGDPSDVRAVLYWVRRGGVLIAVGAVIEAFTTTVILAGAWAALASPAALSNALWSSGGFASALRLVGGLLATSKIIFHITGATAIGDPVVAARRLVTVGAGHSAPAPVDRNDDEPFVYANDHAWDYGRSLGGLAGIALVAVSFMFDGHTASEGPRVLHAIANLTHVTTAAIWAGGVAMLAMTIQRRRRNGRPTQALQLAVRFSVVATIALVAAGVAGLALSTIVLDSISEIWSTPWGRLLALKASLVAVAAAGGAYNHRIVVPTLARKPDHQPTIDRFRSIVTIEACALIAVAIVTAFLIAASSA